ncbi:MAG: hypothetical protein JWO80_6326 [Bryobacterales bacterium]|nr:hypothetical protein [Bryobacterales bacterium]
MADGRLPRPASARTGETQAGSGLAAKPDLLNRCAAPPVISIYPSICPAFVVVAGKPQKTRLLKFDFVCHPGWEMSAKLEKMAGAENLFAYGTLRHGMTNEFAALLRTSAVLRGEGRVNGRLYEISRYPGLVLCAIPGEWVRGDVFELDNPGAIWPRLDAYEGCGVRDPQPHEFERELVTVQMDSGRQLCAFAYVYRRSIAGKPRIVTGDFLAPTRNIPGEPKE